MRYPEAPKNEHGFTMIEMMVVVLIISILAAIAIPLFINQKNKSYESVLKSDLRNVGGLVSTAYNTANGQFKAPVDKGSVPAGSIDRKTQIPVSLSDGVSISYEGGPNGFCIVGVHSAIPDNSWAYSYREGGVVKTATDCPSAPTPGPVAAPAPTSTSEPAAAPTTSSTPAPSPSSTASVPTTETPPPPPVENTAPYVESYTVVWTASGAKINAIVRNLNGGPVTFRASATALTGQAGLRTASLVADSNDFVTGELSSFGNTNPRYWQLELGPSNTAYGPVLVDGLVSSDSTTDGRTGDINNDPVMPGGQCFPRMIDVNRTFNEYVFKRTPAYVMLWTAYDRTPAGSLKDKYGADLVKHPEYIAMMDAYNIYKPIENEIKANRTMDTEYERLNQLMYDIYATWPQYEQWDKYVASAETYLANGGSPYATPPASIVSAYEEQVHEILQWNYIQCGEYGYPAHAKYKDDRQAIG